VEIQAIWNSMALLHGTGHYPEISDIIPAVSPRLKGVLHLDLLPTLTEPPQDPEMKALAVVEFNFFDYRVTASALTHRLGSSCSG
jgi:hypothetical protein